MSIRRFNYTERKRIARSDVRVSLVEYGGRTSFDIAFDLAGYDLPADARLVVEAYRQTAVRRFEFGHVGNPVPAGPTSLDEFTSPQDLLFRAKVVDSAGSGRLLAEADQIQATDHQSVGRRSLIRVADGDLGSELWCLFFDAGGPVLQLERRIPREALLNSPHFKCLVYPQVFRQLLWKALEGWDDDHENEDAWEVRAVRYAIKICENEPPTTQDDDLREDWISTATRAFCRKHDFAHQYEREIEGKQP